MTDPNNPNYFGLPVLGWDADRLRIKEKLVFQPESQIIAADKLEIISNPLYLNSNIVCVTDTLKTDKIEGKSDSDTIDIAGIQIVNGKIPTSALQSQPLIFKDCWDANLNVPPLASGVGNNGDYYLVCVAGSTNLDGNNMWIIGDAAVFNGDTGTWYKLGGSGGNSVTLSSSGGTNTLVSDGLGPDLEVKGLTAGTGISIVGSLTDVTITNTSPATSVSLTTISGTSLIGNGSGPGLTLKGLSTGTGIGLIVSPTDVTITNTSPGSSVTLGNAGTGDSLVNSGTGPNLLTKGLVAGTSINLSSTGTDITITNSSPASGLTLSSAGGTSLVNTGTGPGFVTKGLTTGTGISFTANVNDIVITNTSPGSSVSLANAGSISLVNSGVGPSLATKGLVAGTGISLSNTSTDVTITNTIPNTTLANAGVIGGNQTLVSGGTGPSLSTKGLVAGSGINLSATGTDITISSTGSTSNLANAGVAMGNQTLVASGTGPNLQTKGIIAGTGISLSANGTDLTVTNTSPASGVTLGNAGTTSLVNAGTGPSLAMKGLVAGTGISLSSTSTDVTIMSTVTQSPTVYFCMNASNTGGIGFFGFAQTGGVAVNSFSTNIGILGSWYDPFSKWNGVSKILTISSSKKYISSWGMPIGSYSDVNPPVNTNSFIAWSQCYSPSSTAGDRPNQPYGTCVSFGGGGTGTAGNQICSSGSSSFNVLNSSANQTAFVDLALRIFNSNYSNTAVDVGIHIFPTGFSFGGRDLGSNWVVYEF